MCVWGGGGGVLIDRDTVLDLRLSLTSKDHRLLLQVCLLFRAACLSLWVQGISRGREKVSSQNDDAPLKCFSHVSKAAQVCTAMYHQTPSRRSCFPFCVHSRFRVLLLLLVFVLALIILMYVVGCFSTACKHHQICFIMNELFSRGAASDKKGRWPSVIARVPSPLLDF